MPRQRNPIRACLALTTTTAMASLALTQTATTATAAATTAIATANTASRPASFAAGAHTLTLITGDRVTVGAGGRVLGVQHARGREHVPVQTRTVGGHTLVVPTDAAALIAAGRLDQRLFDVTELNKDRERADQRDGLKVIVGYRGTAATARADVEDAATVRRTLKSLDAQAVRAPKQDPGRLWDAVTNGGEAAPGVAHVWLDAVREVSDDKSGPQIGAPTAWKAGYTGKGVKIAVLDTGVDADHPDLKGQVIAAKNFSASADADDHQGHGTHVASIAAGTGAGSGGRYTGVAPGAKLLNGKVMDDDGSGDDSAIIAGMEWAADQGADIVNMSLGGTDTPGTDPLEAEVNKLSEEKGILFAVAAGNEGEFGAGTVDSPSSAADALSVGAVDGKDRLADFSSTGPVSDGSVKPDVTAPGVDITAAAAPGSVIDKEEGENPPGYLTISGTSMATPHVAGAAAILKQEHPDWGYAQLKAVLMGSAKAGSYTPYQQGTGRIQVDRAITQTVFAEQPSLSYGIQRWPHTDDTPVTKRLTYRNTGTAAVTLKLTSTALDPDGGKAPAGFLTLGATSVTVPAGGTASVGVTVNTKVGTVDGACSGYVVATGGGRTVRTTVGVQREVQSYDVTLKFVNRAGPSPVHLTTLTGYSGVGEGLDYTSQSTDDTVTMRVPKGKYVLDSVSMKSLTSDEGGIDWLSQPVLNVTKDVGITVDLNRARASDITVPDGAAKPSDAGIGYQYADAVADFSVHTTSFAGLRVAHLGPAVQGLTERWTGQWTRGAGSEYDIFTTAGPTTFKALTRHYPASALATVRARLGSSVPGRTGAVTLLAETPAGTSVTQPVAQRLPGTRILHLSAGSGIAWSASFDQYAAEPDAYGYPVSSAHYISGTGRTYQGGRTYTSTFNTAVIAPLLTADYGLDRDGNEISGDIPLFSDGAGHAGSSDFSSVRTTLFRGGTKVGSNTDPLFGFEVFKVPAGKAAYRLSTSVKRSAGVARTSSRIDATWTFTSKKTSGPTALPASALRIAARTDLSGHAPAGRRVTVPVTVQGSAAGRNLRSLAVWVSYDGGGHWTKLAVTHGHVTYRNPAQGRAVSFKYRITDRKGNASAVTVYDAYVGK
ncbi:S8 family serine peptidase [Streptomyces sp. NPDC047061]|uniref:S8 family peptidase n=1 Tax=Streptomyces sp. NPDC047061 TaxID=3154605 RepID=UPI00340BE300